MTDTWTADQVKSHLEDILEEKDRALSMADDEREKAAAALRNEQQRALDQADRERERAADKLRTELARQIDEGDDRLREHIAQQFQQINAALVSAERLETTRFGSTTESLRATEKQLEVLRHAAVIAQDKFERNVESRFEQVNEFRGSLDDLGKTMATRREMEQINSALNSKMDDSIIQRNVKFDEINKSLQEIRSRLDVGPSALHDLQVRADRGQGQQEGSRQSQAGLYALIGAVGGFLAIVIVVANALAGQ